MQTNKMQTKLFNLWGWLKARGAKWRKRLGTIPQMKVEGFEVVDFLATVGFIIFLAYHWFDGPYVRALRQGYLEAVLVAASTVIAAVMFIGFMEENTRLRRLGAFSCFVYFVGVGAASVVSFPHIGIGYIFALGSFNPLWLFTKIAELQIKHLHRADIYARIETAKHFTTEKTSAEKTMQDSCLPIVHQPH